MRQKLFQVEDCSYTVSGKLVLAAKVKDNAVNFKEGDSIILVKPDGTEVKAQARGGGKFKVMNSLVQSILLEEELKKEDIPIGTIIFLDI